MGFYFRWVKAFDPFLINNSDAVVVINPFLITYFRRVEVLDPFLINNSDVVVVNNPFLITYFRRVEALDPFLINNSDAVVVNNPFLITYFRRVKAFDPFLINNSDAVVVNNPFLITYFRWVKAFDPFLINNSDAVVVINQKRIEGRHGLVAPPKAMCTRLVVGRRIYCPFRAHRVIPPLNAPPPCRRWLSGGWGRDGANRWLRRRCRRGSSSNPREKCR